MTNLGQFYNNLPIKLLTSLKDKEFIFIYYSSVAGKAIFRPNSYKDFGVFIRIWPKNEKSKIFVIKPAYIVT